ncbi:MAG: hypothetical protein ACLR1V_16395 [Coprococcus sp.]
MSGQLSRRRRQRRMTEESNSSAAGGDEKIPTAPGMHRRWKVFLIRIMVLTGQNRCRAETQEDKKSELRCLAFPVQEKLRSYPVCIRP